MSETSEPVELLNNATHFFRDLVELSGRPHVTPAHKGTIDTLASAALADIRTICDEHHELLQEAHATIASPNRDGPFAPRGARALLELYAAAQPDETENLLDLYGEKYIDKKLIGYSDDYEFTFNLTGSKIEVNGHAVTLDKRKGFTSRVEFMLFLLENAGKEFRADDVMEFGFAMGARNQTFTRALAYFRHELTFPDGEEGEIVLLKRVGRGVYRFLDEPLSNADAAPAESTADTRPTDTQEVKPPEPSAPETDTQSLQHSLEVNFKPESPELSTLSKILEVCESSNGQQWLSFIQLFEIIHSKQVNWGQDRSFVHSLRKGLEILDASLPNSAFRIERNREDGIDRVFIDFAGHRQQHGLLELDINELAAQGEKIDSDIDRRNSTVGIDDSTLEVYIKTEEGELSDEPLTPDEMKILLVIISKREALSMKQIGSQSGVLDFMTKSRCVNIVLGSILERSGSPTLRFSLERRSREELLAILDHKTIQKLNQYYIDGRELEKVTATSETAAPEHNFQAIIQYVNSNLAISMHQITQLINDNLFAGLEGERVDQTSSRVVQWLDRMVTEGYLERNGTTWSISFTQASNPFTATQ